MPYQQLTVILPALDAEIFADYLTSRAALAVSLEASDEQPVFQLQPEELPLWDIVTVKALYDLTIDLPAIIQSFDPAMPYSIEIIPEQDWVQLSQRQFPVQSYSDRIWVVPSWEKNHVSHGAKVIIDPGLAFGTGQHATTSLCLNWLATHDVKNKIVVDYGCGSGILALAALALGAKQVIAIDHDPQALEATKNNALFNNFVNEHNLLVLSPLAVSNVKADVVIANILANPLMELMPTLIAMLHSPGQLILSGILISEMPKILHCYQSHLSFGGQATQEEWCRLEFHT